MLARVGLTLLCLMACLPAFAGELVITVEHAVTEEQVEWGLMGRREFPENHGMLFHLSPPPRQRMFWMFNCHTDLSLAFLDQEGVIQEIHELRAYPEKMDPKRPVRTVKDFSKYPPGDPVLEFYRSKSVISKAKASYALEMPAGWFQNNGVQAGDRVVWKGVEPEVRIWSPE